MGIAASQRIRQYGWHGQEHRHGGANVEVLVRRMRRHEQKEIKGRSLEGKWHIKEGFEILEVRGA